MNSLFKAYLTGKAIMKGLLSFAIIIPISLVFSICWIFVLVPIFCFHVAYKEYQKI